MQIMYAVEKDLPQLANLFDQYRVFYGQETCIDKALDFLNSRLKNKDSVILIAKGNNDILGFTQLYPSFSSVGMEVIWILNDLFTRPDFRQQRIAKKLLEAARKHAVKTDALRIILATQVSNTIAQNLYLSMGYSKDEAFYHYNLNTK